jgi:hypothetical protein
MIGSSGKRHRELVSLAVAIMVAKQSSHRMRKEFEPNGQGGAPGEQRSSFFWLQVRNGLEIERNCFLQGCEDFFERPSLHSDVKIEADRLPLTIPAFGVAMERSVRHFPIPRYEPHFRIAEVYRLSSLSSIWKALRSKKTHSVSIPRAQVVEEGLQLERAAGGAGEQIGHVEERALLVDVGAQPAEQRAKIAVPDRR